jgi:hypothetical protein
MHTYRLIALIAFACLMPSKVGAQTQAAIKISPVVEQMLQAYNQAQQNKQTLNGFRIQIAQDNNRETARNEKANALLRFPQYEVYELYESPTFKIRVGDFKTRIAAYKAFRDLKGLFKRAFIVEDRIQLSKAQ